MQQKNATKGTFSERLQELLDSKGLKEVHLAREIGVSHTAVGKMLAGTIPRGDNLLKIAAFFGVSMEFLLFGEHWVKPVQAKEGRGPYWGTSDAAPIVAWASAGKAVAYEDQGPAARRVKTSCPDPNCYALEIEGDSMEPIYRAGDVIICAPNSEAKPNDLVMLKTADGDSYFKQFLGRRRDKLRFGSFNPNYVVMEFEPDELAKMHPVWSVVRFLKGKNF